MHQPVRRQPIRAVTKEEAGGALDRLIAIANDYGDGARKVATFLLSWWDGGLEPKWPMMDIANVDSEAGEDMLIIIAYIQQNGVTYATAWDREPDMHGLIDQWNWKGRGDA